MYQAKENGASELPVFQPAMNAEPWSGNPIEESLRRAGTETNSALHYSRRSI